jgi:hypothetical protein
MNSNLETYASEVAFLLEGSSSEGLGRTDQPGFQAEAARNRGSLLTASEHSLYEQGISMYRDHCNKLSLLLC